MGNRSYIVVLGAPPFKVEDDDYPDLPIEVQQAISTGSVISFNGVADPVGGSGGGTGVLILNGKTMAAVTIFSVSQGSSDEPESAITEPSQTHVGTHAVGALQEPERKPSGHGHWSPGDTQVMK